MTPGPLRDALGRGPEGRAGPEQTQVLAPAPLSFGACSWPPRREGSGGPGTHAEDLRNFRAPAVDHKPGQVLALSAGPGLLVTHNSTGAPINFGPTVRQAIDDLSKRSGEDHDAYLARMLEPHVDWRTIIVKLADRLQNLRTLDSCAPDKQMRKRAETLELYLPLIDRCMRDAMRDQTHIGALSWLRQHVERECRPADVQA